VLRCFKSTVKDHQYGYLSLDSDFVN